MKSAAIQKGFYGRANHGAQRTRFGLISLLVSVDIIVEVLFEQLIKGGSLGVSGTVEGRIATLPLSDGGRKRKSAHGSCRRNPQRTSSPGGGAARSQWIAGRILGGAWTSRCGSGPSGGGGRGGGGGGGKPQGAGGRGGSAGEQGKARKKLWEEASPYAEFRGKGGEARRRGELHA